MARAKNVGRSTTKSRLKQPINPSVRGTAQQSGHEGKGMERTSTGHQSEGSGQRQRAGGRGGGSTGRP